MNIKELLPIGSIVILRGAEKRLMIFGVKQRNKDDGLEYDYIGVVYPEGNMGEGTQFVFNHESIEKVFFKGFEDEERETFIEKLDNFYREK